MDVIIVGAGIAGLTAAYHLKQRGLKILLLEKSNRWGGCLHSVRHNGYLLEKGPNSFLASQEVIQGHIKQLGLQDQVIASRPSAKRRFILKGGRLVPFPASPRAFLQTNLLTWRGKLRLLMEPWVAVKAAGEETIAQFVTRRLGREALNLVEPMVHGIYAGDAAQLSLNAIAPQLPKWEQEYGNLFKALRKARLFSKGNHLFSFQNGMQTLADALYERVKEDCRFNIAPASIKKRNGVWQVDNEAEAPWLILAVPAHEAASLLADIDPILSGLLNAISYTPLAVIHLLVDRSQIDYPLEGFGFLAGAAEENFLLGSIWSSSIFEGRCMDTKILLTGYVGGAKNPAHVSLSEAEILERALTSLRRIFQSPFQPDAVCVTRLSKALPQYTLGHHQRLEAAQKQIEGLPGLVLAGNYWDGISVNDTMAVTLRRIAPLDPNQVHK